MVLHRRVLRWAVDVQRSLWSYRAIAKILRVHEPASIRRILTEELVGVTDYSLELIREVERTTLTLLIDESGAWLDQTSMQEAPGLLSGGNSSAPSAHSTSGLERRCNTEPKDRGDSNGVVRSQKLVRFIGVFAICFAVAGAVCVGAKTEKPATLNFCPSHDEEVEWLGGLDGRFSIGEADGLSNESGGVLVEVPEPNIKDISKQEAGDARSMGRWLR